MKILQVIPYFVPAYSYGGPVKVCFDISKELVKNGHQVTVATTDALDNKKRVKKTRENIEGVEVVRFRNVSNWLAKNYNGFLPFGFHKWIKENIREYDIVHCHDFFTYLNLITAIYCKKNNTPFINHPQGILLSKNKSNRFYLIKEIFITLFNKCLYGANATICLTEIERKQLANIYKLEKEKLTVIPNSLDIKKYRPHQSKNTICKNYGIPSNNFIIGYLGRIQNVKGIDISLEILSLLKKQIANFRFLVIGPDEREKNKLINQAKSLNIKNKIIFTGGKRGSEKIEIMNSCDVFLFTSRSDGMPITSIEAAALKKPQVISNTCNIHEDIKKNQAGLVFNLLNKNKAANLLKKILNSKKLSLRLGENGRKMVEKKYVQEKVVDKFELLYNKVLNKY